MVNAAILILTQNTLERKRKSVNQVKNRNNGTLDDLDVDVIVE